MNRPDFTAAGGAGGDSPGGPQPPLGPPWSVDVVADVQAGVYPPELNEQLRARILADPEGREIFQALDSVSAQLSSLPALTMPAQYAARLDAALTQEASARAAALGTAPTNVRQLTRVPPAGPAPTMAPPPVVTSGNLVSLDAARSRRRGVLAGLGIAAAVAAIAAVTLTLVQSNHGSDTAGSAVPGPSAISSTSSPGLPTGNGGSDPTSTLRGISIDPNNPQAAFDQVNGKTSGDLSDPLAAASCFAALKLSGPQVLGVSDADIRGQSAYAIAVTIPGNTAQARLIVVAEGCGSKGALPTVLLEQTVAR